MGGAGGLPLSSMNRTKRIVRRSQEERRRTTQDAILDAVIELLLERGHARLTAVDVAERAGVSRGAQSHYFRTKQDLILATARRAMASAIETSRLMAQEASMEDDIVHGVVEQARRFFFDPSYIAMIEILLVARTDAELAEEFNGIIIEVRKTLDEIWHAEFVRRGVSEDRARILVTLTQHVMRGLMITTLWGSDEASIEASIRDWATMVETVTQMDAAGAT